MTSPLPYRTRTRHGFTLLEMSVVLAIIALIAAGSMVTFTAYVQSSQYNATVAEIDTIEKAIKDFSVANDRIPCPSSLTTLASDSVGNYGAEAGVAGFCATANYLANGVAEGGVPTRTLRLPDSYMYDAWGRRLRYAVDVASTVAGTVPVQACPTKITIYDGTGHTRSTAAIYAIVSHGANGHGAYTSNGVVVNAGSTNGNEQANCHCNSSTTSTGYPGSGYSTPSYVQMLPTLSSSDSANGFDDIVAFKESWQLASANNAVGVATCGPTVIYALDGHNARVEEFSMSGSFINGLGAGYNTIAGPVGTTGTTNGEFGGGGSESPRLCVAVDSGGNIWVPDKQNNRVQKYNSTGTYQLAIGCGYQSVTPTCAIGVAGSTNGKFNGPECVKIDSSDNVFVEDTTNGFRIQKFNTSGIYQSTPVSSGYGTALGKVAYAPSFNVDASGNFWVADNNNYRLTKFSSTGVYLLTIGGGGGQANPDNGNHASCPASTTCMNCTDTSSQSSGGSNCNSTANCASPCTSSSVLCYCSSTDRTAPTAGQFIYNSVVGNKGPSGVTFDAAGNVWVGDAGFISEFNPTTGAFITRIGSGISSGNGKFGVVYDLAIDTTTGFLWVADQTCGRVEKMTTAGSWIMTIGGASGCASTSSCSCTFGITNGLFGNGLSPTGLAFTR